MAIIASGDAPTTDFLKISPTFNAMGIQEVPLDHAGIGHYTYGATTGVLIAALSGGSELCQFINGDSQRIIDVRKIVISATVSTTFFAAGVPLQIDLVKSKEWIGSGNSSVALFNIGSGSTRRSTMLMSVMERSSAYNQGLSLSSTGALPPGIKTMETLSLATFVAGCPITASLNETIFPPTVLWQAEVGDGEHPLILNQYDGFSIRCMGVPATGTWRLSVTLSWVELISY